MLNDINGLLFCGFIIILLMIFSMILRSGRGAFLISIYNLMSPEKKALYNEKALCIVFGNLLLAADFIVLIAVIAGMLEITWLIIISTMLLITIGIGTTIYAFTSEKYRTKTERK
jgi:hypothetical protein